MLEEELYVICKHKILYGLKCLKDLSMMDSKSLKGTMDSKSSMMGSFSKGSSVKRQLHSISLSKKKNQKHSLLVQLFFFPMSRKVRLCCIFPGSILKKKKFIDKIFAEVAQLLESKHIQRCLVTYKSVL